MSTKEGEILLAEWFKTSVEKVRILVSEFKKKLYISIRVYYQDSGSEDFKPTKKGITLPVVDVYKIKDGIDKAIKKIEEMELIKEEERE